MTTRHSAAALQSFADALLRAEGMNAEHARDVAAVLVEGDLLGHTTHGLALLAAYLGELEAGAVHLRAALGARRLLPPPLAVWMSVLMCRSASLLPAARRARVQPHKLLPHRQAHSMRGPVLRVNSTGP